MYNIGGDPLSNMDLTGRLLELYGVGWDRVRFVKDRKGHDRRYAVDDSKIRTELGYVPRVELDEGLPAVAAWYRENRAWWNLVQDAVGYG